MNNFEGSNLCITNISKHLIVLKDYGVNNDKDVEQLTININ